MFGFRVEETHVLYARRYLWPFGGDLFSARTSGCRMLVRVSSVTAGLVIALGTHSAVSEKGIWYAAADESEAQSIARSGLATDVCELVERTSSGSWNERLDAVQRLNRMGERARSAVPFLLRLLKDPNYDVQWYVAELLSSLRDRRGVDALVEATKVPNAATAECAVSALASIPDPRVVPARIEVLVCAKTPATVRRRAGECLSMADDPRALKTVLATLNDQNVPPLVRSGVLRGLGRSRRTVAAGVVRDILLDRNQDKMVRVSAATALVDLTGMSASQALTQVATDLGDDPLVRFWAAMDDVFLNHGEIERLEVVRAMAPAWGVLPHVDPEGLYDEDAYLARLVAYRAVAERGGTRAVRSAARRVYRSMASDDQEIFLPCLMIVYFVAAMVVWGVAYRALLTRRRFTLRSALILIAIVAVGLRIPDIFDAIAPLSFDRPSWDGTVAYLRECVVFNENLPRVAIEHFHSLANEEYTRDGGIVEDGAVGHTN
jgi:HEAT repeat protein